MNQSPGEGSLRGRLPWRMRAEGDVWSHERGSGTCKGYREETRKKGSNLSEPSVPRKGLNDENNLSKIKTLHSHYYEIFQITLFSFSCGKLEGADENVPPR